jgi:GTP-binding protein
MEMRNVTFIKSSPDLESCPKASYPEYAFAGRSNVGKSSLINMLVNMKNLAKTSSTPGKTRLINHFLINDSWFLVDLPGYGYARSSKSSRNTFLTSINEYLLKRESLACLFLLIDCRHKPLTNDLEVINWIGMNGIPFALVFTKSDKISETKLIQNIGHYRKTMLENWEQMPDIFVTSSFNHKGRKEIIEFIIQTNKRMPNIS